jgi:hypothetical protein
MFSVIACLSGCSRGNGESGIGLAHARSKREHRRRVNINLLILLIINLFLFFLPMGLIMRTYHSSVFPLRKTLLALTIGAITHSAAAAESKKSEETMVVQATPPAILKPAAIWWCLPISTDRWRTAGVSGCSASKTPWTFRLASSAIPRS